MENTTSCIQCVAFFLVQLGQLFRSFASQRKRKDPTEYSISRSQQSNFKHHYKCIEAGSIYPDCNGKYITKAIPKESFDSELHASNPKSILESIKGFLVGFYWFVYPYTIFVRILSTASAAFLAVEQLSDISPLFCIGILQFLVPFVLMDFYATGLNQLFDIELDKINKPHLPLPSGQISFTSGVIITVSCAILSFWMSWMIGSWPLIWSLIAAFVIGSGYSINVPLLRWKRNPVLAAMVIIVMVGVAIPISVFFHMKTFVLKRSTVFPRSLTFVVAFMSIYCLGIAFFKDIPDVEGDKTFGVQTFAGRFGEKRIFWICVSLFEMAFGVAILTGTITSSVLWIKLVSGLGHGILASILWYHAKSVDLSDKASIKSYYMLVWKLLSVAYFLLPLVR